jgi:hypothetical protein
MALVNNGSPILGYVSLNSTSPGPVPFALTLNGAPYVVPTNERIYITNITVSSNNTPTLVTIDDGPAHASKLLSAYCSSLMPPCVVPIPLGVCRLEFGQTPRASASAAPSGTIECTIYGYVSRT